MLIREYIKPIILFLLILILSFFSVFPVAEHPPGQLPGSVPEDKDLDICISQEELMLYELIMNYRSDHGLPEIPLSKSLTYVARQHTIDLATNYLDGNPDCNLHSWSGQGIWTECCYTDDHKQAGCMWNKPEELTNYTDLGFEIVASAYNSIKYEISPDRALNIWIDSPPHNAVVLNLNQWEKATWQAIGIGIYEGYAAVWFGMATDGEGPPEHCK